MEPIILKVGINKVRIPNGEGRVQLQLEIGSVIVQVLMTPQEADSIAAGLTLQAEAVRSMLVIPGTNEKAQGSS